MRNVYNENMKTALLKNQKGVTLMEVIILVIVLSLFIVTLLPMITENMVQNAQSKTRLQAYEAAHKKIEDLRNTSFGSLTSGTFQTSSVPRGSGVVTITNDINDDGTPETGIVKAKVDVNFTEKNKTETVTLTTLIAK